MRRRFTWGMFFMSHEDIYANWISEKGKKTFEIVAKVTRDHADALLASSGTLTVEDYERVLSLSFDDSVVGAERAVQSSKKVEVTKRVIAWLRCLPGDSEDHARRCGALEAFVEREEAKLSKKLESIDIERRIMSNKDVSCELLDSRQKEVDLLATKIFEDVARTFNEREECNDIFNVAVFRQILDRHFDSEAEGIEKAMEESRKRSVTKLLVEVLDSAFPDPSQALTAIRAVMVEYVFEEEERFKESLKKCLEALAETKLT